MLWYELSHKKNTGAAVLLHRWDWEVHAMNLVILCIGD